MHDSLFRNIMLQEEEHEAQKLDVIAETAGISSHIDQTNGMHTEITEEGKNITGGQRQRILLARALYKDFDVPTLDEPFNRLDECSKQKLLTYLQSLAKKGKMIILLRTT